MGGVGPLRIRLLGGLSLEGYDDRAIGSRKARTLLKALALARGKPVSPDAVVDALWPGDDAPSRPVEQVGVLVSRLRSVLGAERLPRSDAGWALVVDWLDVVELEDRVHEAAARLAAGSPAAARAAARAALDLARGPLLADEPDAMWADTDRAAAERLVARARVIAAEAALAAGDAGDAAAAASAALDHDPYDEAALRTLMRAHAAAGRPASALAAYAKVRARLGEDLGVDPVKETEDLHTAILLGDASVQPAGPAEGPPFVGRREQLAALDGYLAIAGSGEAAMVVVEGEAGIGKTALLRSWTSTVSPRAVVLTGRCDELAQGLPLQPVVDALAGHLRRTSPDERAAVLDDAPALAPLLGPRATVRTGVQPTTVTDPVAGQAVLFAELLAAIERVGGDRPVVLLVEDIHLAAPSTGEWLRYALHRGHRLLLVASRRANEGGPLPDAHLVRLGPLDLHAVEQLVGSDRAADLLERSGGHPLFLVELAAAGDDELPASIRESVAARIDGLGDAAATLRAAAVLGSDTDIDVLAGVLDEPVAQLLEHLEAGVRARVIEERSGVLAFRHELVREAILASTTAARRAYVHREAARVLCERARHDPLQVAFHAQSGGDVDLASAALVEAATMAADRYDVALAERLLGQAIELADGVASRLARARVRIARWDTDGARADAQAALAMDSGAAAFEVAGWVEYYRRDYDTAFRYAEEAVARSDDPGLRASCLAMSGRVLHAGGDLPGAEARLVAAVAEAPPAVRGYAQVWLGGLRVHQGRTADASDLVERALAERRWLGHPFAVHHGRLAEVLALGQRGLVVDALRAAANARAEAVASGDAGIRFVAGIDNVHSWLMRGLGNVSAADEQSVRVLESTAAVGTVSTTEMHHAAMLDLVDGALLRNDLDGAAAAIDRARPVDHLHGTMDWHHRQRYLVQQARFALATGDPAAAQLLAERAVADAHARGSRRYEALGTIAAARARVANGEPIDHDDIDGALAALETCAGLEAWLVTAEIAAATGVDRWWRDAERRAGALVAASDEHAESLRRWVGVRFAALGHP